MQQSEYEKYNNKAISVRLQDEYLDFFLKFAQERQTPNISETFKQMIDELKQIVDLDHVEFKATKWGDGDMSRHFLKPLPPGAIPKEKETLTLNPIKLPEIKLEPANNDEDDEIEEVFTI